MKKILPLIPVSLLTCIQAFVQINSQQQLYASKVTQYTSMKRAGATLTVTGIACLVAGFYRGHHPPPYTGPGKAPSGITNEVIFLIAGGIACTGTGIPLWTIGGYNQGKYKRKLTDFSIQVNNQSQFRGLTLSCRF